MNRLDVKWINTSTRLIGLFLILFVSACSTMPEAIQYENPQQVSVQSVHQGATNINGQTVRWGGIITQVINNENGTWVEVLALNLNDAGRPSNNRLENEGRFIAKVDQFLDPEVYQQGYSFTVVGTLTDKIDGKIGEYKYSYPTINAQGHYLWPKYSRRTSHYVMPGYWYYGFHSQWHFGYNYYGYGIRHHRGIDYPYYPFYGHLTRRDTHLNAKPSALKNDNLWKLNTQRLTRVGREASALTRQADYHSNRIQPGAKAGHKTSRTKSAASSKRSSRLSSTSRSNRPISGRRATKKVTEKIN
ncbi:MAG: outer membrane lipoprotein [Enterobacterales bacterium]|jgi:outer membrane lipoprotein